MKIKIVKFDLYYIKDKLLAIRNFKTITNPKYKESWNVKAQPLHTSFL